MIERLEEGDGLDAGDLEALAAADVLAADQVVGADHVALGPGGAGGVPLVGAARDLGLLAADEPSDLVFACLAAVRAGHSVGALLGVLVEKVTFFHCGVPSWNRGGGFRAGVPGRSIANKSIWHGDS